MTIVSKATTRTGEIRALTGMRGVAALVVVAYHYVDSRINLPSAIGPGYVGVDLFFILSGFVMAMNYGQRFQNGFKWRAYVTFLQARFARVYPLYICVTLATYILIEATGATSPNRPTLVLAFNTLAFQGLGAGLIYHPAGSVLVGPAWSISVEVGAYLLFPMLAMLSLFRSHVIAAVIVAASLFCLITLQFLPTAWLDQEYRRGPFDIYSTSTLWPLARCFAGFMLGLVAWRVSESGFARSFKRRGIFDALLILILAVLWAMRGMDVLIVFMFPLLILQISTDTSPIARLLGSRLVHFIGELSYAIYLIHIPAAEFLSYKLLFPIIDAHHVPHAWTVSLFLIFIVVLFLAWLSFEFIEKPSRRKLRLWFNRPVGSIDAEPAAP